MSEIKEWKYLQHGFLSNVVVIISSMHTLHVIGTKEIRAAARTGMTYVEWKLSPETYFKMVAEVDQDLRAGKLESKINNLKQPNGDYGYVRNEFKDWWRSACAYLTSKIRNGEQLTEYEKFCAALVIEYKWN